MSIDSFVQSFADLEIFRGLRPAQLTAIARTAERILFRPGQTIVEAGQPGEAAFVIIGGQAAVADTAEDPAPVIVPGTLVGEMAMLIDHDYRVTVVAEGPVKALKLTRQALHQLMLHDRAMADHFVARVSSRLQRMAVELRRIDETLTMASEMAATASVPVPLRAARLHEDSRAYEAPPPGV